MYKLLKNKISQFLTNGQQLFALFIIVNMIPSILLIFTEPFNIWGKIVLILFPLGTYLILLSIWKKIGITQLLLFPLLFLHAFQIVLFYLFGENVISVDMYLNVATTNPGEAGELLGGILPAVIFVIVVYLPTTIIAGIACKKKVYTEKKFRKRMISTGVILLFASFATSFLSKDKNTDSFTFYENVYPVDIVYNLGFAINKWNRTHDYPRVSKDFTFNAKKIVNADRREIYVLVVGETSRAENWSLYGYERKTNPLLEKETGLVHYSDAITQANATHKSVPIILSGASAENFDVIYHQKSIFQAFKEAGFKTAFLSNQSPNHSFTDFYANEADYRENIRPFDPSASAAAINHLDEDLIPFMKNFIDSLPNNNLFIVLHTYGSHFNYKERYPERFSQFKPDNVTEISQKERDKLVNAFDNTILYTDFFLHQIIQMLKQTEACTAMAYSSDHGEDIMDDSRNRFLHASPDPTYYQLRIPILTWFSENYETNFPKKVEAARENQLMPVATNALFHTMLDMSGIETSYKDSTLSLLSLAFKIRERMYLDNLDNPVFYYNMNLKKQDKEMIEKRKLHH